MRWQGCREIRASIILARMAAGFGRRRTAGRCGNRSSTKKRLLRLERWRWRLRIPKSFTWERASTRFLATAVTEMEFTSPRMAGRTGSTWAWRTRGTSEESWLIQRTRISYWSRRWGTVRDRTKIAGSFGRRMADGRGREFYTKTM